MGFREYGDVWKALTIMTAPQANTMNARKFLGPTLRMMTVAGGWNTTYGMKNSSDMIEYALFFAFILRSLDMLYIIS
jgi:hypothetical protein